MSSTTEDIRASAAGARSATSSMGQRNAAKGRLTPADSHLTTTTVVTSCSSTHTRESNAQSDHSHRSGTADTFTQPLLQGSVQGNAKLTTNISDRGKATAAHVARNTPTETSLLTAAASSSPPPQSSRPIFVPRSRQPTSSPPRETIEVAEYAAPLSGSDNPTTRHSHAEVKRVKAALAEAGYPNPSWRDIERVFAQFTRSQIDGESRDAGRNEGDTRAPATSHAGVGQQPIPQSSDLLLRDKRGAASSPCRRRLLGDEVVSGAPTMEQSDKLLHYLSPSLRLQRYIQQRERELEEMCVRPTAGGLVRRAPYSSTKQQEKSAHEGLKISFYDPHGNHSAADETGDERARVTAVERWRNPRQAVHNEAAAGTAVPVAEAMESKLAAVAAARRRRRAANILFNYTGDQRFRFFPTTRIPQGAGTVGVAVPHRRSSLPATSASTSPSTAPHSHRNLPGSSHLASATSSVVPHHNFYCPRPQVRTAGGVVASGNTVSYLDPVGRSLRRPADPVKRGAQMRLLWAKDAFLSQRHRPREAWRTRQITMTYDPDSEACQVPPM